MITCPVCPHHCRLEAGGPPGVCRARHNVEDRSAPLNYGRATSLALDPIEKKPLARFMPGSSILSYGSFGCNMGCYFCQNNSIAAAGEGDVATEYIAPERLLDLAQNLVGQGNIGAAFTYNEPMVGFEYIVDCGRLLRAAGLKTVVVTNGCFDVEAVADVFTVADAFNIDLKGFTAAWYRRLGGELETVKTFITRARQSAHVELTTLIVPEENDSPEEMRSLAQWVALLDKNIPLHVSRFFPRHRARRIQPTDPQLILQLADVAARYLTYVYLGNL